MKMEKKENDNAPFWYEGEIFFQFGPSGIRAPAISISGWEKRAIQ